MVGLITHIQKFSVHDGPGIRTTVFFKGCPLSCPWCQNPETIASYREVQFHSEQCVGCGTCSGICSQGCFTWNDITAFNSENCNQCGICIEHCPVNALRWSARLISTGELLHEIVKDRNYFDLSGGGVTLSGGEPLQQVEFCLELLKKLKRQGINTALDTSGYAPYRFFKKIMPYVDIILFDIKIMNEHLHEKYTKVSNSLILENFRQICMTGKRVIVRIPVIPGFTDAQANIAEIEKFVKQQPGNIQIEKIPFNPLMAKKYQLLGKICSISERSK